jgi:hypothetical protein
MVKNDLFSIQTSSFEFKLKTLTNQRPPSRYGKPASATCSIVVGTDRPGWSLPLQAVRDATSVAPGDTDPTLVDTDPGHVVLAATGISLSHEAIG